MNLNPKRHLKHIRKSAKRATRLLRCSIVLIGCITIVSACSSGDESSPEDRLLARAQVLVKEDPESAIDLAKQAAERDHIPSMIALGHYETIGRLHPNAVPRAKSDSLSEAMIRNEWFVRARKVAATRRSKQDLLLAAFMNAQGRGGEKDFVAAGELMFDAIAAGVDERNLFPVAMMAMNADDDDAAKEIYTRAQEKGFIVGYQIEALYRRMRNPWDIVGSSRPLAIAAEKGDETAIYEMKVMMYNLRQHAAKSDSLALMAIADLKANDMWQEPEEGFVPLKQEFRRITTDDN